MSLPNPYALVQAGARAVAWLTALTAIVVLAYVGNCWPSSGQAIIAGLVGVSSFEAHEEWWQEAHDWLECDCDAERQLGIRRHHGHLPKRIPSIDDRP